MTVQTAKELATGGAYPTLLWNFGGQKRPAAVEFSQLFAYSRVTKEMGEVDMREEY